jgi:HAE1 family hydrophobic/amphiphilic exporter-1
MGSEYVNNFDFNNRSYRVYLQAEQQFRENAADIRKYYVRSAAGQMIPLDNLVTIENTSGPQVISHYNLFRSAEIDGSAAPGVSTSVGLQTMEQVADQNMMHGMGYEWTGLVPRGNRIGRQNRHHLRPRHPRRLSHPRRSL